MKNENNPPKYWIYKIISLIVILLPIITILIAWYYLINTIDIIDNKKDFTTLLFTFISFFITFGFIKILKKHIVFVYILLILPFVLPFVLPFIVALTIPIPFIIILITAIPLMVLLIISLPFIFLKYFHENYFKLKYIKNLDSETEFKYSDFKLSSKKLDKDNSIWKNIIGKFIDKQKQESLNLAKKNILMEEFTKEYKEANILNILSLKHFIGILHTFYEAIVEINKEEKKEEDNLEKFLQKIIFMTKFIHLNMGFVIVFRWLKNILNYFFYLLLFVGISLFLHEKTSLTFFKLIKFDEVFTFILGIAILVLVIPMSYFIYLHLKFFFLEVTKAKHDDWNTFFKNLYIYISSFTVALIMAISSVVILNKSGVEFSDSFHFISLMILPTIGLNDIPHILASLLGDDIVFGIFGIKLFVLFFIFAVGILLIWHIIELYIEKLDRKNTTQYSIPPEFAKFFSYLIVFIFSVVLFYGTFFINYPNMSNEYKVCKPYLEHSLMTHNNCENNNSCKGNSNLYCTRINEYCTEIEKLQENKILNTSYCKVAMSLETNNNKKINQATISSNRSLSDYLPLSIFLALFGAVMMIATKNLLENYFIGLSLKINPPYEEGERVRVDGGEMLAVEEVGFRATTFYGIQSNAHLVIPHQKLVTSVITNYTKPTLDYRQKLTIYIPDKTHNKSIPREAEKILLLSAFINTGVKKPSLVDIFDNNKEKEFKDSIESFRKTAQNKYFAKLKKIKFTTNSKLLTLKDFNCHWIKFCKKSSNINNNKLLVMKNITECEKDNNDEIEKIWKAMSDKVYKDKEEIRVDSIFLKEIYQLVEEEVKEDNKDNSKENHLNFIKKLLASIVTVLDDYQKRATNYHIDDYCVRRKFNNFDKYKAKNQKDIDEINKKADYLVNISYYYFALAKQLWQLKESNKSEQKKNKFDKASLELLDVPRVTSVHKRDIDGAFWEVTLLMTVELGEQSDEVIHHVNMYIDDLWDIFGLPSYCDKDDTKIIKRESFYDRKRNSK